MSSAIGLPVSSLIAQKLRPSVNAAADEGDFGDEDDNGRPIPPGTAGHPATYYHHIHHHVGTFGMYHSTGSSGFSHSSSHTSRGGFGATGHGSSGHS